MPRDECADSAANRHRPRVRWKLVIAAETVWNGEVYHTRSGHERASFCSVEAFCRTVMEVTGWPLDLAGDSHSSPALHARAQGRGPRLSLSDPRPNSRKIVLAADDPWCGELYLTRPGLARIRFTSFEELLVGVMQITGWSISAPRTARVS